LLFIFPNEDVPTQDSAKITHNKGIISFLSPSHPRYSQIQALLRRRIPQF
jgi:hypothetical protein